MDNQIHHSRLFFLTVLFFVSIQVFSQTQLSNEKAIDSSWLSVKKLSNKKNTKETVQKCVDIAWDYMDLGSDKVLIVAEHIQTLSEKQNYDEGIVKSLELKGLYYEIIKGDFEKASAFYFEAVTICEKRKLPYLADIYHTVGVMFHTSDNYEKAKKYYENSYKKASEQNNLELQKKCLINLGSVHSSMEKYDIAESFFLQGLEIKADPHNDFDIYANLGNLYIRQEDYRKALPYLEKATEKHPDNYDSEINLRFLLDVKAKLKDTTSKDLTMQRAESAIHSIKSVRDKSLLLRSVSDYYESIGDYEKALKYKGDYLILYEEIIENQKNEIVADLEAKYQNEKTNATLEKKEKQQQLMLMGIFILLIIIVMTFIFYKNRLNYQKTISLQKEDLQKQKIMELTQKNKLLAMNSMLEGQEEERLRIAKDLHDSLGGLLSSVKAHFTIIKNEIHELEQLSITERTNQLIDEACLEVRRISHNMMPHSLSLSGLKGAVEDIAGYMDSLGFNVTLDIHHLPEKIDTTKQITIYRLIQEILSNIRKHSEAKGILIQLFGYNNEIQLIVEDDGKGFDYEQAVFNGGLGLKNINSRVEFLDGTIQWESVIGEGTTVTINFPV